MASDNEYDSMLGAPTAQALPGNEYDAMIQDDHSAQKASVQSSMYIASPIDPDRHAKVIALGKQMNLPTDLVDRNYDQLSKKQELAATDYDKMVQDTPALAKFMESKDNAGVAKDDLAALAKTESTIRDHSFFEDSVSDLSKGFFDIAGSAGKAPALAYDLTRLWAKLKTHGLIDLPPSNETFLSADNAFTRSMKEKSDYYRGQVPDLNESPAGTFMKNVNSSPDASVPEKVMDALSQGDYSQSARVLFNHTVANFPSMAALIVASLSGAGEAAAVGMGVQVAADKHAENLSQGVNPDRSLMDAGIHGVVMANLDRVTLGVLRNWSGAIAAKYSGDVAHQVMQDFGKTLAASVLGESGKMAGVSVAQDFADYATGVNPDAMKDSVQRAIDGGLLGGAMGGMMVAPSAFGAGLYRAQEIRKTEAAKEFVNNLIQQSQESKLRERAPELHSEFVQSAVDDTAYKTAQISPKAIDIYFQSKGINPLSVMTELGLLPEYGAAKEAGTNVHIPLSQFVNQVVENGHQELVNDIKFHEDDKSVNELSAEKKQLEEDAKKADEAAQAAAPATEEDQSEAVREKIAGQLKDLGHDPQQAVLISKMIDTMAKRVGIDPQVLADRYNLSVTGEAPTEEGRTLQQRSPEEIKSEIQKTFEDPAAIEKYNQLEGSNGGAHIDTDLMREIYEPYKAGREGAMVHADLTDEAAGKAAQKAFTERLARPGAGPDDPVMLLAGGAGSGKSRFREDYGNATHDLTAVFDSTSANYNIIKSRIEQVLETGRPVIMNYIYRPFEAALEGNASRFKRTGRLVAPNYMAYSHVNALDTFLKLAQEYRNDPRVDFAAFDNSKGQAEGSPEKLPSISLDELEALRYTQPGESLNAAAKRLKKVADGRLENETSEVREAKLRASGEAAGSSDPQGQADQSGGAGVQRESGAQDPAEVGPTRTFNQSQVPKPVVSPLGFFSQVGAEIDKMDFKTIPAKDLLNRIKNIQGIKKEEMAALGLEDWLNLQEGKVSKEQVQDFVNNNGPKVEQVVLSEDYEDHESDGTTAHDLDWREPVRDESADDDHVQHEYEYFRNETDEDYWDEEKKSWRADNIEEHTDEDGQVDESGLDEAWEKALDDLAYKRAREYVEDDDYHNARFIVRDRTTGWELRGNDESGWYSPDIGEDLRGNLEEAKLRLVQYMINRGEIEGNIADSIKPKDVEFRSPTAQIAPAESTVKKRAAKILSTDTERLRAEAAGEYNYAHGYSAEELKTEIEGDIGLLAKQEARAHYDNPDNPKAKVTIQTDHPFIDAEIVGNNSKGYELTVYGKKYRSHGESRPIKFQGELESKTVDGVKAETLKKLQELKMIAQDAPAEPADPNAPPPDVNAPTGGSKFERYSVAGRQNYREVLLTLPREGEQFTHRAHFDEPNILAHVRISDRVDAEGRKTFFIEELQSDWHQQGRERGYKDPADSAKNEELRAQRTELAKKMDAVTDHDSDEFASLREQHTKTTSEMIDLEKKMSDSVPDAPFKNTEAWASLALKRMVRMAVEQGYDSIAWTPADVHVDRWGTDAVSWVKKPGVGFEIRDAEGKLVEAGRPLDTRFQVEARLESAYGKDSGYTVDYAKPHFLVGSAEQRGGNADGVAIEEIARARGELLERKGERVTTKEELRIVVADTLGRERNDRSLDSLTEQIWKQMQEQDTGAKMPRKEGMEFFYNKLVPDTMKKILKKIDPAAKIEVGRVNAVAGDGTAEEAQNPDHGMDTLHVKLTDKLKETVSHDGFSLFQNQGDTPRGQINIGKDGINIQLLKDANRSTFIHETGHFYLEVLKDTAAREDAPAQVKQDWETVQKYLGHEEGDLTVDHHETFARSFEAYLMEGKAPSSELRKAFIRFKTWLVDVYKSIKALNVNLTPEVSAVFDRMIATDEEIANAEHQQNVQPLFTDPAKYNLNPEQFAKYQSAMDSAKLSANDQLRRQVMEDIRKEETQLYKEEKTRVRAQVEETTNNSRRYKAIELLQRNGLADGTTRPEGSEKIKIDRKSLVDWFGEDVLKKLPRMHSLKDGTDVGIVADMLGYESPEEMIRDISNPVPRREYIDQQTDIHMKEVHPDLYKSTYMPEQAMDAIHNNSRASVLRMEMNFLREQNPGVASDVTRLATKRPPSEKAVQAQVEKLIGQKSVADLNPNIYLVAERQAAAEAGKLLAAGDLDGVHEAKRKELLNHEVYRQAKDAKDNITQKLKFFKRVTDSDANLSKYRDTNLTSAAKAVLASFGIGKSEDAPAAYLEKLKAYDPDGYVGAAFHVQAATENGTGNYREVPYGTFNAMAESVKALWDLAKSAKEVEIDGKKVAKELIVSDLNARINDFNPETGPRPGYEKAITNWEKTRSVLLSAKAMLRRTEHWVTAMDGGDKGSFRTNIWNPISDATSKFQLAKEKMIRHYLKEVVLPSKDVFARKPIAAPEINYTFANKGELLGALLHIGNESNLSKLLRGRGWGSVDENGVLDRTALDRMLTRFHSDGTLGKADYDYAQGVWDMNEMIKPDAQRAYKKLYGHYFAEITAHEVDTPFGKYKGGYVPAIADPNMVEDQALRREKESLEQQSNMTMMPTTGRGFTKSRVDAYAAPLAIDLNYIPMQIDKVLRFTYMEPVVRDVSKIVMDRNFRDTLSGLDSSVASEMLIPWLQRAASQSVSNPSGTGKAWKAADWIFRKVRGNAGLNAMTLNVINTFHQTTGFSVASAMVEPRYLRDALWSYLRDAKGVSDAMHEKSEYMQAKGSKIGELQSDINDILLHPSKFEKGMDFVKQNSYILQRYTAGMVEAVAWQGGYTKGVELGYSEQEAIRYADSVVRQTQHSASPIDVSRFGTGSPFMRMFTMYFDYYNNKANLNTTQAGNILRETGVKKGMPALTALYVSSLMIPAIMSESAYHMAGGRLDENDDHQYMDDVMKIFFGGQLKEALANVPVLGPLITNQINRFNDNRYDDRLQLSPAIENLQKALGAPKEIMDAATGKGKISPAIRDSLSLLGMMSGLPVQPLAKPLGYAADVAAGKVKSSGPLDYARGLVTGQGPKR